MLARVYARDSAKKSGRDPKVLIVNVRVHKTADLDDPDLQKRLTEELDIPFPKRLSAGRQQTRPKGEALAITRFLKSLGYDSAVGGNGLELVVFDPRNLRIEEEYTLEESLGLP
jgi:hypothetical protein